MFNRFVVIAASGMLGLFVVQWASACPSTELEARCEAEAELAWHAASGLEDADGAYEDTFFACTTLGEAQADVLAAPSFCAATVIELTPSGRYRAVCVLEGAL